MQTSSPQTPPSTEAAQRLQRLRGFLQQDPDNVGLRSQTIAAAIAVGEWDAVDLLLQEGFARTPEAAELHAHAGFAALHKQAYEQAKTHFNAAISQGLSVPTVRYNLAFSQFLLGQHAAALEALALFAPDEQNKVQYALLKARCLHHIGDREGAITVLMPVRNNSPEVEGLLALLMYEVDRNDDALEAANRALTHHPHQLEALLARAATLAEQDQFELARTDYQEATVHHPHSGRAWSGLAQIDFHDFKFDDALKSLERAVDHMPNHIGTWHLLAWIHVLQGRVQEGKAAFQKSYELDRNFGETHGGLAVVAAMEKQVKLAEEHIKRATRLNPNGFAAQYARLLILEQQGKTDEAQALLKAVMQTTHPGIGIAPQVLVDRRLLELAGQRQETRH